MEQLQIEKLKENYSKFLKLYNELKRAKNQKERTLLNTELDALKSRLIREFDLREFDNHISHYSNDNYYFEGDVESIIRKLEKNDSNS